MPGADTRRQGKEIRLTVKLINPQKEENAKQKKKHCGLTYLYEIAEKKGNNGELYKTISLFFISFVCFSRFHETFGPT